ncbi:hypothetical protein DFAR_2710008 [Desulfarculales bacterium]
MQGVIPISRGQGCPSTLGPFLITGPTSKVQNNEIKSLPSQANLKDPHPSRSEQSKNQHMDASVWPWA